MKTQNQNHQMSNTKKIAILTAALALLAVAPVSLQAATGISGTKHDLSTKGWGSTSLCIFCHTAHNSDKTVADAPLWNHKVTTASFTLYASPTLQAAVGQPSSSSRLCLSCHDGTVAIDSFGGVTGTHPMTGTTNLLGTDLSNDHPISFTYDATLAANNVGGLVVPASASKVDAAGTVPLFAGKMECASCHQSHNNANPPFLRIANTGSALCLKCHTK
jgi:predicted CXXCH cytochrome family protein